jgi:hypothetical protein
MSETRSAESRFVSNRVAECRAKRVACIAPVKQIVFGLWEEQYQLHVNIKTVFGNLELPSGKVKYAERYS